MEIINTGRDFIKKNYPPPVGLVPTMGNLHQGHLDLIQRSLSENTTTVISIFVNPKQFGPNEDFKKYPRTLEQDKKKLESLYSKFPQKNCVLFSPLDSQEVFLAQHCREISLPSSLLIPLCGQFRPEHFAGVAEVVNHLFRLVKPNRAYFGQKDYQQFKVVEIVSKMQDPPIQLTLCPTVRDANGLALSSRNQYLSSSEYQRALRLPKTILQIGQTLKIDSLKTAMNQCDHHLALDSNFQYLTILNAQNLLPPKVLTKKFLIAGAYLQNGCRLIDNILLD